MRQGTGFAGDMRKSISEALLPASLAYLLRWQVWLADSQGIPAEGESCDSKMHGKKVRGEDPCGPLEVGAEG